MTHIKENAQGKALNSIGRSTGHQFNMAAIKREMKAKRDAAEKKAASFDARWEDARIKRNSGPDIRIDFGGR